jgi:GNAT superfamily N-acetyltransferase
LSADLILRAPSPSDIESMRALERRASQVLRAVGYDFCADGPIRDAAEHLRTISEGVTFVAEAADGAIAGFAMIEPMDGEAHLVEIDVDPAHQKKGLARQLIAAGEAWALAKSFDGITLTTYRDISWNAPFYRRLGFVEFTPEPARAGLLETIENEAAWGFAFAPRIAMRKQLT